MYTRQNTVQIASSQINSISNSENIKPSEISSDKQLEIHDMLYIKAIEELKSAYPDIFSSKQYVITELGSGAINDAPFVSVSCVPNNNKPIRYLFSLENWWSKEWYGSVSQKTGTNVNNIKSGKYKAWSDWTNTECTYIDYVNGKAEIKSKIYGWKRIISLDLLLALNKKETMIPMSEIMSKSKSSDMFSYQYQNNSFV